MDATPLDETAPRLLERRRFNAAKFLLAAGCIGWIWLVGLPWLGQWQPVRQHVDRLNTQRINASAMFYTELEPALPEERDRAYSEDGREASK
ncbi:MAG: hypothetical protein ACK5OB_20780 [Pirellula sp.]|jgi:hypothetical protein